MVHLTLAISDFMLMLISAVMWTAARFAGWGAMAGGVIIGMVWWARRRKH